MVLPHFLSLALESSHIWIYLIVVLGAIVEGPIVMVASGFLLHQGYFILVPLFLALLIGDLIGDIIWYYIGYFFARPFIRKYGTFFGVTLAMFEKAQDLFHRYHVKILLISKITLGFGLAIGTLLAAGATRVSFRTYLLLNLAGECILITILMILGYFFGKFSDTFSHDVKIGLMICGILIVGIGIFFLNKHFKNKVSQL